MDFYDVVDQVAKLLRHRGRVTFRALKLQFGLDDETLETLKGELLYSQPQVVDDEGRGLLWTGDPSPPEADAQPSIDSENRLQVMPPEVKALLQRDGRLT